MKIALPITSFLPNLGGMEVGVHNLAQNLVSLGHEPIVITSYSIFKNLKRKEDITTIQSYLFLSINVNFLQCKSQIRFLSFC